MPTERMRRIFTVVALMALVIGTMSLTGAGTAGACEELQVKVSATARGYDAGDARYLDGIVTNDTTQTLMPTYVKVGWVEDARRTSDEWICSAPLKPGEWTAFHADWPCGIPTTWTPVVSGYAWPSDAEDKMLELTVDSIGPASVGENGSRTYPVRVTNNNSVPVSSLQAVGVERDASTADFVDALVSCEPDALAVGQSATFDVTGLAPWGNVVSADLHVSALEKPTITLAASTTSPSYGSPVTFTLSLSHADGSAAVGCRTLKLFSSTDGEEWCDYTCYDTGTGTAVGIVTPDAPTYYKAVYWGGDDLGCAESDVVFVTPQVTATTPSVPASVRARRSFKVSGRMSAGAKSKGKPVVIITQRMRGSKVVGSSRVTATADSAGRYKKSVKLTSAGTYRIRAYRAGVGYTRYKTLKVKK
jgi:hypothetical protein